MKCAELSIGMQMAVLRETDGKGPFSSLTMAVVIVKDVVVFVCFAINIEIANVVRNPHQCLHALESCMLGTCLSFFFHRRLPKARPASLRG